MQEGDTLLLLNISICEVPLRQYRLQKTFLFNGVSEIGVFECFLLCSKERFDMFCKTFTYSIRLRRNLINHNAIHEFISDISL